MKILITGATGLIGSALAPHLQSRGHEVSALRRPADWDPETSMIRRECLEGMDAVVHLAGENIASGRWTAARKRRIRDSRVKGTTLLAKALAVLARPPKVLISASAIGYYGDRGQELLTEASPVGSGFLSEVSNEWESCTEPASRRGIRTVHLRIGIVLSSRGGALRQMRLPFRLGVGGALGSGKQYMSWITIEDLCRAIEHVLATDSLSGAVNAVAPEPATNREFTTALARAVWRPALFSVPPLAARAALGEMAEALLLASTRVLPQKLLASGFVFHDSDLPVALARRVGPVYTLNSSQWIKSPLEQVFPFFANAGNLDRITPPWLRFEIQNPETGMRKGSTLDYRLRLHGLPIRWRSEILEWEPPLRFVDVQRRGPYTLWFHEHTFESRDGGTLVHDRVEYAIPGGALVQRLFVDRDLQRIFQFRRAKLEQIFA